MSFTPSPALLDKFRVLAKERLERVMNNLDQLRETPADAEVYTFARRELHTLKGEAGMLGFRGIFELSRALERLLKLELPILTEHEFFDAQFSVGAGMIRTLLGAPPGPPEENVTRFVADVTELLSQDLQA